MKRSLYERSLTLMHIGHTRTNKWIVQTCGNISTDSLILLFTK